jgi:hypothetical protein
MRHGRGNINTWRKPNLVPLCPQQIPYNLTQARNRAAVGSQRLNAWPVATLTYFNEILSSKPVLFWCMKLITRLCLVPELTMIKTVLRTTKNSALCLKKHKDTLFFWIFAKLCHSQSTCFKCIYVRLRIFSILRFTTKMDYFHVCFKICSVRNLWIALQSVFESFRSN